MYLGPVHGATGALAVLVALGVDELFGEPRARWHPVVWIGRALAAVGAPWPGLARAAAFACGALAWLVGASLVSAAAAAAQLAIAGLPVEAPAAVRTLLQGVLLGALLKPLLSWRLLRREVAAVEGALSHGFAAGRERLSHLVSRDTSALSATVVRESALESLAENLNDSLVAPLFWFAVGGLPAAALYRFANTADAMWGYHGRFEWAGKWAARADDVLSYVPARASALLLAMAAWRSPRGIIREARSTPSPNGGWPMAMLALALDVRLSKPGHYVLNAGGRDAGACDLERGIVVAARAVWGAGIIVSLALLLV